MERLFAIRKNVLAVVSALQFVQRELGQEAKKNTIALYFLEELERRIKEDVSIAPKNAPRILITGTPMAVPNWKMHNIVETSGGIVVCEENCTGTRYFTNTVKENNKTMEEAASALTERYFNNIHCACFTPNPERIDDILRLAKEYQVDGILNVNLKFCNLYATENYFVERRLKEEGYKVLSLETDYEDSDAEQLRTRVSAFLEMIEANK